MIKIALLLVFAASICDVDAQFGFSGLAFQRPCTVCQTGSNQLSFLNGLPCINSLLGLSSGTSCPAYSTCVGSPGGILSTGVCQCYAGYTQVLFTCVPTGAQAVTNLFQQAISSGGRPTTSICRPPCHTSARCTAVSLPTGQRESRCICLPGYSGNGYNCVRNQTAPAVSQCQPPCHPSNANCVYSAVGRTYTCQCKAGYFGDGRICNPQTVATTCRLSCHPTLATCRYNPSIGQSSCQCNSGYSGNGVTCTSNTVA
uniref:EGF-like domain-containing protein n=1 Tax=Ciona savignyi TaxID=51511 RepID=H2Y596_CIOSA